MSAIIRAIQQAWDRWARDIAWGVLLYLMALATLFFIFAQGEAKFIYAAF